VLTGHLAALKSNDADEGEVDFAARGPFRECPLLAQSGHPCLHRTCPLSGVKRYGKPYGSDREYEMLADVAAPAGVTYAFARQRLNDCLAVRAKEPLRAERSSLSRQRHSALTDHHGRQSSLANAEPWQIAGTVFMLCALVRRPVPVAS
jgi:hypothetical protein